jgi:hypothetical protein
MDGVVPRPSTIVPGYPPELEACVMKALARSKPDRYATARDFARGLEQYLVRSGHFVGPEEVAQLVRGLFADRIQTRAAHLAWAAEVTSTGRVEKPRAGRWSPVVVAEAPAGATRPSAGLPPPSMVEEDEDVPTTITTRGPLWAGAPVEDLGATVALPLSVGPMPSPSFGQHTVRAPVAPLALPRPVQLAPTPPVWAMPARPSRHGRAVMIVALLLLAVLGVLVAGALAIAALRG